MVPNKGEDAAAKPWVPISDSQLKKQRKTYQIQLRKLESGAKKEQEKVEKEAADAASREKNLADAKQIVITENQDLPAAILTKIRDAKPLRDQRIKVHGWVHRLRRQGKALMFINLRDGTGYLQAVLTNTLCQTVDALLLQPESSVTLYGMLTEVPAGKTADGGHELIVDFWELVQCAPPGGTETIVNKDADIDTLFDNRHLVIRGEQTSKILKIRSHLMQGKIELELDSLKQLL